MRLLVLALFLCSLSLLNGQKIIKKTIASTRISSISIDLANCYSLELDTADSNEILVEGSIAGADNNDVLINIQEKGGNISLSSDFQPNHIERTSKFGALTYVAIDLKIVIPENLLVRMFGTSTQVEVKGNYKQFELTLADGNCKLMGDFESASIKTQEGDITVNSAIGTIDAKSSYGKVSLGVITEGDSVYVLNSIQGNIYVNQTD
ncbi:hypothetical protein [Croceivirga thetidis]|uniref:Adhesin domain-containing protein n=1 Tax=Croceivirga thetidis TaxID=2721623 RepID=A0ABX1GNI3_9FLAO|nr:hypothetical protein [Croceivirga thetidis]NKI31449.1 hypothetical protein [Croceivirga thetidis]